jgi:uncharacterized membrane protein YfcA
LDPFERRLNCWPVLVAALLDTRLAHDLSQPVLRRIFALVMALIGLCLTTARPVKYADKRT